MLRFFSMSMTAVFLLGLALAPNLSAQAELPTACFGDDVIQLRKALESDQENLGLRIRVIRRLLNDFSKTADIRRRKSVIAEVRAELQKVREQGAGFTYVYRVLAKQAYRDGKYEEFLEIADEYQKIEELDFELRSNYVTSLLRLSSKAENGAAMRTRAVKYVCDWFNSSYAPDFGTTLGAVGVWLIESGFRKEFMSTFGARYKADPRNLNLAISYAACLRQLGRNESAWEVVHAAEQAGLCSDTTGGRHAIVSLLDQMMYEERNDQCYDGNDIEILEGLAKKFPENASFPYRLAVRYRTIAYVKSRVADTLEKNLEDKEVVVSADNRKKWRERIPILREESQENHTKALPHALRTLELNPSVDGMALLVGDIHRRLGQHDKSVAALEAAFKRVPFFVQLKEQQAEVYVEMGDWKNAALALAEVCARLTCRSEDWESVDGKIMPVPQIPREVLITKLIANKDAKDLLLKALSDRAAKDSKNPKIWAYLAMAHFYAGNRAESAKAMLTAERCGMSGRDGLEFDLASRISVRDNW